MDRNRTVQPHEYPPARWFRSLPLVGSVPGLTVRRAGTGVAVLVAVFEIARLADLHATPIPFDYPLYFDVLLVYIVLYILESLHGQLDDAKSELIVLARISEERANVPDEEIPEGDEIRETFETRFERYLNPVAMAASGLVLGGTVTVMMWVLGVTDAYPYVVMNFVYGAAHGIALPFVVGLLPLLKIVPAEFMNDINGIDPTGVGGYPSVGESIAKAAWYGTVLINVDFIILGSVAFLDNAAFQTIVIGIYVLELVLLFGLTLGSTLRIRNILKEIRDRRIRELQWQFGQREGTFLSENPHIGEDAEDMLQIMTYTVLFQRLNDMDLWPINMVWWTRFVGGIAATVSVILIQLVLVIDVSSVVAFFRSLA